MAILQDTYRTSLTECQAVGPEDGHTVRHLCDFLASLAIWVILIRGFAVEGYIISTGSMAPHLLGYHKRVKCPSCGYMFAFGVRQNQMTADRAFAVCPNCGQGLIDISRIPINAGDQLLVHKNAYQWQPPHRWDIVVFRSPDRPTQAYVKRLVGLPNEQIQIVHGDVYINGMIQRKNLRQQHNVRILVYDHDYQPKDSSNWSPRWVIASGWQPQGHGFEAIPLHTDKSDTPPFQWVFYRHWIRTGGSHATAVTVQPWPKDLSLPEPVFEGLRLDPATQQVTCRGVLDRRLRDQLLALSDRPEWQQRIRQLEEQSHVAPITDQYGYDRANRFVKPFVVRDLMIETRVTIRAGDGQLVFRMLDEHHVYDCLWDVASRTIHLLLDGRSQPIASAPLPILSSTHPIRFEMSLMDRQVLVALDGETVFAVPIASESLTARQNISWQNQLQAALARPIRIGTRRLNVRIDSLKLFRDVYYTDGDQKRATNAPYQLGIDEYFFLGDNSPISLDSRCWSTPTVRSQMILGKPFLLHLPSRPYRIQIGHYVAHIRIPDVTRIRYID